MRSKRNITHRLSRSSPPTDTEPNRTASTATPVYARRCPTRSVAAPFAHELSNLLDGSLRNVAMALRQVKEANAAHHGAEIDAVERLQRAGESLRKMAGLLQQWMAGEGCASTLRLIGGQNTLGEAVECAMRIVEPAATVRGVSLHSDIAAEAAGLPSGPLDVVLINGLKNAVEAAESRVMCQVTRTDESVRIRIIDDGRGIANDAPRDGDGLVVEGVTTKSGGHGLGLSIVRSVTTSLGGTVSLRSAEPRGAQLMVTFTAEALIAASRNQP